MRKDDKNKLSSIVTLIEDPYGLNTFEISEAQDKAEELELDNDLLEGSKSGSQSSSQNSPQNLENAPSKAENTLENGLETKLEDELEDQLSRIAQAMADHTELPLEISQNPHDELAAQIAEDQALDREVQETQASALLEEGETGPLLSAEAQFDGEEIQSCMEALLYLSDKPLSLDKFRNLLGPSFEITLYEKALAALRERYQAPYHGIELVEISGGYQFRTKPGRADLAKKLVRVQTQRLSSGSMETLAIIAYKQPVMKEEIDKIRGVDSSYFVRGLMERKLIQISGRSELPGRPILYTTTSEFLEVFGLKDLSSLPSLRELEEMIPGSQSAHEEDDPRIREMRRLVSEMKADRTSALHYNPKEDEKILKEIREHVNSIPTSTPYLDEMKAAEILAEKQALTSQTAGEISEGGDFHPTLPSSEKAPIN